MECSAFLEDSTSFPGMWYLIGFIDTARTVRNFAGRAKLISSVFKKRYIELIISKTMKFPF